MIMQSELVSTLTRLISPEDFIAFIRRESLKPYKFNISFFIQILSTLCFVLFRALFSGGFQFGFRSLLWFPLMIFSCFYSVIRGKCYISALKLTTRASFHIISSSSFKAMFIVRK
jgi:hypothetical protein